MFSSRRKPFLWSADRRYSHRVAFPPARPSPAQFKPHPPGDANFVVCDQTIYLNNRAENSHQPTRQRERRMKRFKSPRQAQQFLSAHGPIHQHSHPRRHRMSAAEYRAYRAQAFEAWKQETCAQIAA